MSVDEKQSGLAVYRRLLGYVRPYWKIFSLSILGMIVMAATEPGFAALMKPMLDGSFVAKDPEMIALAPMLLVVIFITRGISGFIASYSLDWVARNVIRDLRGQLFSRLLNLPSPYYDKASSGQLLSKLIYDVEQVANATSKAVTILVKDSLAVVGLLIWMFYLNWVLSLTFLVVTPFLGVIIVYVSRRFRRISTRIQNSMGDVTHVSEEAILGQRVIKIFGGQRYEKKHFDDVNEYNRVQQMKMAATNAGSVNVIQFMVSAALALIIYIATLPDLRDDVTVGTFMSFMMSMMLLLPAVRNLTSVNAGLQQGIAAAQSVFELIDSDQEQDKGEKAIQRTHGALDFRQVAFAYESSKGNVLEDINLTIEPGQTVAFVGRSGSGKSTLVSLLPRFYDVSSGEIVLDGTPIEQLSLSSLRQQIALVSQEVVLFNDTILRNIAYGTLSECSEAEIIQAAEAAHVMEFVNKLPEGINTLVGEGGALLSGGQRQRLAIARALLKDAPILILDEATSALDNESERHIQAALEALMRNRTTLVIAHRLSTIEHADKIVVMEQGRIVETGTHNELLAKSGRYAELYNLQFAE